MMFDRLKLYFKLVGIAFNSQMQHRASFLMLATAHFLSTFIDIIGIWVLFDRFKLIQGWTFPELTLIYGIMQMGFATAEMAGRGFDTFGLVVKNGEFDRILLRPAGTLMQVATREISFMRIGRFLQGLIVLVWGCLELGISFTSFETLVIVFAITGAACLFGGLMVIQGTLAFWTVETLELMNILTFGGLEAGQYPMSIYKPPFQLFFTFVVPLASVAFYPVSSLLQHEDATWWGMAAPVFGILFLLVACQLWKVGVRRYQSTGN
jgi:ABC-2 type transport system permease protein